MKRLNRNVSSRNAALQERPEILHSVRVDFAIDILNSVVNYLMLVFTVQPVVAPEFIRIQRGPGHDVLFYHRLQGFLFPISDNLGADFALAFALAAFKDTPDNRFVVYVVALASNAASLDALVHVASLAADESFIHFHGIAASAEFSHERTCVHGEPD